LNLAGWGVVLLAMTKIGGVKALATRIGHLITNLDTKRIATNGASVYLTGKEYKLLELLWLHKGKMLSREFILKHSVWWHG
jgi:DNA-binding response OmpR family regulator